MDNEKLNKFALNQLSEKSEIEEVINWIEASDENKEEFNALKNLWAISDFANYDSYVQSDNKKSVKRLPAKVIHLAIVKYAAIFILAFLIGGGSFYFFGKRPAYESAYNEIIVPVGESAKVILPDKTQVWMNSGSRMIYPTVFAEENRDVKLSGEAFFEVIHNPKKPFHVVTSDITVEVLGTSFNVEAFSNANVVNVTLVEGKVNLKNTEGEILTFLSPGQNANYNVNGEKIKITNVDIDFYTSWKEGLLVFKDEMLFDIAKKLERWYNVKVMFENEQIKKIKFSGTILKNKPIDQILDILKYTSGIEYTIEIKNNKPSIIYLINKPMK